MLRNRIVAVAVGVLLLGVGVFIGSVGTRAVRAEDPAAEAGNYLKAMHTAMESGDVNAMTAACEGFMKSKAGQEMHGKMMGSMMGGQGMMGGMMNGMTNEQMLQMHEQHHG